MINFNFFSNSKSTRHCISAASFHNIHEQISHGLLRFEALNFRVLKISKDYMYFFIHVKEMMKPIIGIFPIEVDLSENMLNYNYNKVEKADDTYKDFVEKNEQESTETSDEDEEFEDSTEDFKEEKLLDLSLN